MKRDDRSPQHYIDSVDEPQKTLLLAVREVIQEIEPNEEERINYGMLEYGEVANLAAQKNYVSLYVSPSALDKHKKEFPEANCGKSCLRFSSMEKFNREAILTLMQEVRRMRLAGEKMGC